MSTDAKRRRQVEPMEQHISPKIHLLTVSCTTLRYSAKLSSTSSNFCCRSARKTKYGSPSSPPLDSELESSRPFLAAVSGCDRSEFELPRFIRNREDAREATET